MSETQIYDFDKQVQEQARERRRSDRKEKRELDKEKSTAENRARALEGKAVYILQSKYVFLLQCFSLVSLLFDCQTETFGRSRDIYKDEPNVAHG